MENNIYVVAAHGTCNEFISGGKRQTISSVISALKINQIDQTLRITSGCNMWKACENPRCQYSIASHNAAQTVSLRSK